MVSAGIDLATRVGAYLTSMYQHVDKVPVTFDNFTYVRGYDMFGARVGRRRRLNLHWTLGAFAGADNLTNETSTASSLWGRTFKGWRRPPQAAGGMGTSFPPSTTPPRSRACPCATAAERPAGRLNCLLALNKQYGLPRRCA